jgi:UPF0755 protein
MRTHKDIIVQLQEGTYIVSGTYTASEFLAHLAKGPEKEFISYTVLEGRSIYDIDDDLAKKGYIQPGEYIAYTTNPEKIAELSKRYEFLQERVVSSLEGFLYPDTYYLDNWDMLINQLVSIQLNTFKKKIREPYANDFHVMSQNH